MATTRDLLAIPTSNLLSWKIAIRRLFEQIMKAIKISFFEKLTSKEKATFLWFDLFLWVIIINYIPPEREFNEHSKNLNRKGSMTVTDKVMAILLNVCRLKWYFKIKFKWSYLKGRSIESAKFWYEKVSL